MSNNNRHCLPHDCFIMKTGAKKWQSGGAGGRGSGRRKVGVCREGVVVVVQEGCCVQHKSASAAGMPQRQKGTGCSVCRGQLGYGGVGKGRFCAAVGARLQETTRVAPHY